MNCFLVSHILHIKLKSHADEKKLKSHADAESHKTTLLKYQNPLFKGEGALI